MLSREYQLSLESKGSCYFQSNRCLLELQSYMCKMRDHRARYAGSAAFAFLASLPLQGRWLPIVSYIIATSYSTFCCSFIAQTPFCLCVFDNGKCTKRQKCATTRLKKFLGSMPPDRALSALFSKGDLCNPPFLEAGYGPGNPALPKWLWFQN